MSAARVTAGASDSPSVLRRSSDAAGSGRVAMPSFIPPIRHPSETPATLTAVWTALWRPSNILTCREPLAYCSTYRRAFSMLDAGARVKRRKPVSRFRTVAPAIGLVLVLAGCNAASTTPSPAASGAPAAAAPAPPPAPGGAGPPRVGAPRRHSVGSGLHGRLGLGRRRIHRPEPGRLARRQVQGDQRQHPYVQRPAGRRTAPAARA